MTKTSAPSARAGRNQAVDKARAKLLSVWDSFPADSPQRLAEAEERDRGMLCTASAAS